MNTQSSALSSDDRLMTDKETCDYPTHQSALALQLAP